MCPPRIIKRRYNLASKPSSQRGVAIADELEKTAKQLDAQFPDPSFCWSDGSSFSCGGSPGSTVCPTPDVPMQDIFSLYRRTQALLSIYKAFAPQGQWVQAFEAENTEGHGVDLFDFLHSPISLLQGLEWSDKYQEARFFTSLSKAIEQYCGSVEELSMTEMFPRLAEYLQPQKSFAWLERAKSLPTTGEKKVEPSTSAQRFASS
ncbi:hypothetical protein F4604DRAFT_1930257 [Suillus subluteus]|nr:hypothetical protein F4604DRAFT_1930257 [Suillus subluteus]